MTNNICIYLTISFFVITAKAYAVDFLQEPQLNFSVEISKLHNGNAQFSTKYLKKRRNRNKIKLNLFDMFETSGHSSRNERLLVTKVSYIINKPIENFTQEETTKIEFMERTNKNTKVLYYDQNNMTYRMKKTAKLLMFSASFEFNFLSFGYLPKSENIVLPFSNALEFDEELGTPDILSVQKVSDFTEYFVEGVFVGKYYALSNSQTLVVYYQLVFVNHKAVKTKLPFFFNVEKKIKSDAHDEIASMIEKLRNN